MARKKSKGKCLYSKCKEPANTRGLCRAHYRTAQRAVAAGQVTWEQLEKNKLAKPASSHREFRALLVSVGQGG